MSKFVFESACKDYDKEPEVLKDLIISVVKTLNGHGLFLRRVLLDEEKIFDVNVGFTGFLTESGKEDENENNKQHKSW